MKQMEIFESKDFGSIRTILENNEALFCGSDVAKALGYEKPQNAVSTHCRYALKRGVPHPQNPDKTMEMSFIPEGDVYRLIVRSKLPSAERFEKWVFDEVLPTMRKSGGYVVNSEMFVQNYLPFADEATKNLFKATLNVIDGQNKTISEQRRDIAQKTQTITAQSETIEEQRPKAEYYDSFIETEGLSSLRDAANQIGLPERLFITLLRDGKFIYKTPKGDAYRPYAERNFGYFKLKDFRAQNGFYNKALYLTPKGKSYFKAYYKDIIADFAQEMGT